MSITSNVFGAFFAASVLVGLCSPAQALTSTTTACDSPASGMPSRGGFLACSGLWSGQDTAQLFAEERLTTVDASSISYRDSPNTLGFEDTLLTRSAVRALNAGSLLNESQVSSGISPVNDNTQAVIDSFATEMNSKLYEGPSRSHPIASSIVAIPVVPEPGSYMLMLAGLSATGFFLRHRRSN